MAPLQISGRKDWSDQNNGGGPVSNRHNQIQQDFWTVVVAS